MANEKMSLIEAKQEAMTFTKKNPGTYRYILVDAEGECEVVVKEVPGVISAYKNGNEIALKTATAESEETTEAKTKVSNKKSKSAPKEDDIDAILSEEPAHLKASNKKSSQTKSNKVMATKAKPAKKAAKKTAKKAAATKSTTKAVKKAAPSLLEIKADSIAAGVKEFIKQGGKKGVLNIKGKLYAVNNSQSWAVRKTAVELGKDGIIMIIDGAGGYYLYPKADHKELFGKIFASGTWEKIGIYSQSTLPKSHAEYWNELKK